MSTIEQLNEKADVLQATVDTFQAKTIAAVQSLQETIADLQNQIANGATPEQLQAVADKLEATKADLESTPLPEAPAEEAPAPVEGEVPAEGEPGPVGPEGDTTVPPAE